MDAGVSARARVCVGLMLEYHSISCVCNRCLQNDAWMKSIVERDGGVYFEDTTDIREEAVARAIVDTSVPAFFEI